MNRNSRIIFSNNGTLSDLSLELNDYRAQTATIPFVAGEDYLYVGSCFPFNHLWFDVATVNNVSANVSVDIWWASAWHSAFDVLDATSVSGVALAQSGLISWVPDNFKGWDMWSRNDANNGIQTLNIFDLYWCRIKWSANLLNTTALKFIGQKFASDTQMYTYYPDLNNTSLKTAFGAGKTDWNEQHFAAAREIANELKRMGVVLTRDQILDPNLLEDAAIHKCAEIIYQALGKDYKTQAQDARLAFKNALNLKSIHTDLNNDARLNPVEVSKVAGVLYR